MTAFAVPLLLLSSLAQAPTPRDVVARAVSAMGGDAALRNVRSITTTFYSMTFGLGQEETPESPPRATLTMGTQVSDFADQRHLSITEVRTVAGAINQVRRVVAGRIGMTVTNGAAGPDAPGNVAAIERGWRRAPERLLLTALDNPATLQSVKQRTRRGESLTGVRYANGPDTLELYFDGRSGLPVTLETLADDPILGDRRTVLTFTRWQDAGGVLYPRQLDTDVNGRLQSHTVLTAVTLNAAVADSQFVIPDSIKARAQPSNPTPPPVVVTLVQLAPNVWRAEGGSHHSLIIDQGSRLVVAEAPLSTQRMEAVLDTLRSKFPGKPVGVVINTHHHWDHASGLRTVLVANLPIVTHARNVSYVRSIASARKTVRPDALSHRPSRSMITGVEDSLTIGSGEGRVVVYRLPSAHVEGLLTVYVPSARILFQSDIVSATPPPPAGSAELVRFVAARGLAVERVAGGHGPVVPWPDIARSGAPASGAP